MGKLTISKLFLYKHRFLLGYLLLGLAFFSTLFLLPLIAPNGLSTSEMESAVTSHQLNLQSLSHGNIVDLPYHTLQKYSIRFLGLSSYSIKLPSIIIGGILGLLFVLLLNRWFKSNVAIIASILAVLSSTFLYLVGSGTPLIMLVFWPALLLWLGSKIQGKTKPKPLYCFFFAVSLLLSLFTPYLIYLAIFILLYVLFHPHLRFTVKSLPKLPLILTTILIFTGVGALLFISLRHPTTLGTLLFTSDFSLRSFFNNLNSALLPFFSWTGTIASTFLSPLIGLASLALAITGLISTAKGFFASRNSIASYLILYTILISGLNPNSAVLLILPLAILMAHGIRYILTKWYGLFPENPYARIFAILPISIFLGIMITSDLSHFIFGYRYNPPVANQFTADLSLIKRHLPAGTTLLIPAGTLEYDFYKILEQQGQLVVTSNTPTTATTSLASLGKWPTHLDYQPDRIITSSKSSNSDRIYLYIVK
ncbi:MAG: glycosyltransferase family 39 protein [Candidatus Saccharibacteria bacterium]|nr:glycosyltransferase family 39 protein [Candidatus Saccharibacteria bacterium]